MQTATTKLMQDLRAVVGDAEELLKETAAQPGERFEQVRARAEESVRVARARLEAAARDVSDQVHENPWTAIGVAAGVGLVLGIVLARK